MNSMTATRRERRKKEIKRAIERKDLARQMRIGLAFDTEDGRRYQTQFRRTGIR